MEDDIDRIPQAANKLRGITTMFSSPKSLKVCDTQTLLNSDI